MLSAKERMAALKRRQTQSVKHRDQTGGGRKSILDLTVVDQKVNHYEMKHDRKDNDNLIDIIPFIVSQSWYENLRTKPGLATGVQIGEPDYKLEIPIHRNVGPDNAIIICLNLAFGKKCPICEERALEWDKDEKDQDEKKLGALKPKWRCLYNVYDYDAPDKDIQLFDISWFLFEEMLLEELAVTEEDGLPPFSDPEEGASISFRGRQKSFNNRTYGETSRLTFQNREPYDANIMEDAFPLDAMLKIPTYDEVARIFLGLDEGEDIPSDEPPSRARPERSAGRRRPRHAEKEEEKSDDRCPHGGVFGRDCNEIEACRDCAEELFQECASAQDEVKKEPEPEPRTRSRAGRARPEREGAGERTSRRRTRSR